MSKKPKLPTTATTTTTGSSKFNKKSCPSCGFQVAVARKICTQCTTPFSFNKKPETQRKKIKKPEVKVVKPVKPTTSVSGSSSDEGPRRRTERVKREKPNFYDASVFQSKVPPKKKKPDKSPPKPIQPPKQTKAVLRAQLKRKEKKRLKNLKLKESVIECEVDNVYESIMTPSKAVQCAVILNEINNKFLWTTFNPK